MASISPLSTLSSPPLRIHSPSPSLHKAPASLQASSLVPPSNTPWQNNSLRPHPYFRPQETQYASWILLGGVFLFGMGIYYYLNQRNIRPQDPNIERLRPIPLQDFMMQ